MAAAAPPALPANADIAAPPGPFQPYAVAAPIHGFSGPMAQVQAELGNLRQALTTHSTDLEGFKNSLHRRLHAILTAAIAAGNGTVRIPPADINAIIGEITAAINQLAATRTNTPAEVGRTLAQVNAQAPHLARTGGWTPKPRRKITKRRRKSFKSRS